MQNPNYTYPRSATELPEAKVVKEKMLDFTKTVAGKAPNGESYVGNVDTTVKDEDTGEASFISPLMYVSLGSAQEWKENKAVCSFTGTMGLNAHETNPEHVEYDKGRRVSGYDATLKAARFFEEYGDEYYRTNTLRPMMKLQKLFVPLCVMIKALSPSCEFIVETQHPFGSTDKQEGVPDFLATRYPSLRVTILLKSDNAPNYDFSAALYIKTPAEALRLQYCGAYKRSLEPMEEVLKA